MIPVDQTSIKMLYVFVDIKIDALHFIETLKFNFKVSVMHIYAIELLCWKLEITLSIYLKYLP